MKQVKIEKTTVKCSDGKIVICPLANHPESEGVCDIRCAWFRVEQANPSTLKFVYCDTKLIGEIVSEK